LSLGDRNLEKAPKFLSQYAAASQVKRVNILSHWLGVFNIGNTNCFSTRTEVLKILSSFTEEDTYGSALKTSQIWDCMMKNKFNRGLG
jgi:hypothetical protein